jgi:putative FmdB family regulatory protein
MPLYEYSCEQCKERSEILQNISDAPATRCPKCGGALKKLFSAPAIQFKGSGFYKTDYASASSAAPSTSSSTTTPAASTTTSTTPAASTTSSSSDSSPSSSSGSKSE